MPRFNIRPSSEVVREAFTALILAEDWDTRFDVNIAARHALSAQLNHSQDPLRTMDLAAQRQDALMRVIGSGALAVFTRSTVAERNAFEAEFGQGL